MKRNFNFSIGEYYHIYNRGTDKRIIFTDANDYNRFITLLHLCNSKNKVDIGNSLREGRSFTDLVGIDIPDRLVDIGAYCLMPNHFHLLVREKTEGGITKFMGKLSTGYSMYFNKKHNRTGSLFEGRFKARCVDTDEYLKYLFAYIHLNPVKIIDPKWKENGIHNRGKAKEYLRGYHYSSYSEYVGVKTKRGNLLNRKAFPEYFSAPQNFNDFIEDWLDFSLETENN